MSMMKKVAICNERGIKMPSFFGYMAWSVQIATVMKLGALPM